MSAPSGPAEVPVPPSGERLAYTMPEGAAIVGVSERMLYKLAQHGAIRLTRLGRRTLVSRAELERVLAEREAVGGARLRIMP